jgi:hypothetical protein
LFFIWTNWCWYWTRGWNILCLTLMNSLR